MAPPPPCSIIRFPAARAQRKPPSSTIAVTARQPFGDRSSALTTKLPAALLTRTSTRPNRSTAAATRASTASGSRTSVGTASPSPTRSATVSSSGSGRLPATATAAPRRPSSSAIARPRPVPPPVTIAVLPSKVPSASMVDQDDTRVEPQRALRRDEQGIDLDLRDLGMLRGKPRQRRRRAGRRPDVDPRVAASAVEERRDAERAEQRLRRVLGGR